MKLDEFAFVNQQLAGMLRCGVPLEGALRQTCHAMQAGQLRTELRLLEEDLARGIPLRQALGARKLPPFYAAMFEVGAASNNLPAMLTLLADYYQQANLIWIRLKGLMVYPVIVLGTSLALSAALAVLYGNVVREWGPGLPEMMGNHTLPDPARLVVNAWLPVALLAAAFSAAVAVLTFPALRNGLRWRLPAFKEARLSQLAAALALMLQNGCSLDQALQLLRQIEAGSPAESEIALWQVRLAEGNKTFPDLARGGVFIPPLFIWLVAVSGEDWVNGFKHAAEIYAARATHRIEMFLYAVLPVSILGLGILILGQITPIARILLVFMNSLGDVDSFGE